MVFVGSHIRVEKWYGRNSLVIMVREYLLKKGCIIEL